MTYKIYKFNENGSEFIAETREKYIAEKIIEEMKIRKYYIKIEETDEKGILKTTWSIFTDDSGNERMIRTRYNKEVAQ